MKTVLLWAVLAASASAQVTVPTGGNIQTYVSANAAGTSFLLSPGTYRGAQVTPLTGDTFTCPSHACDLNGAIVLTFVPSGSVFSAPATVSPTGNTLVGVCTTGTLCEYPQDLYINSVFQTPVASKAAMTAGTWYFDRTNQIAYLPADPTGHVVEFAYTEDAFGGNAANVTISYMTIEKYGNAAQEGAVGGSRYTPGLGMNWTIDHVEARFNHGAGVQLGPSGTISNSYIHHNGEMGVGCYGPTGNPAPGCLIVGNEISFNNTADFNTGWEAGGGKIWNTSGTIIRANNSHDNVGPCIWFDYDNLAPLVELNTCSYNSTQGVKFEIGYGGIIRNNILQHNGNSQYIGNADIELANQNGAEIYFNAINVDAARGGIGIINAVRGSGPLGPYIGANANVHDNAIYCFGIKCINGNEDQAMDGNDTGNVFNRNRYAEPLQTTNGAYFENGAAANRYSFLQFQGLGQELNGAYATFGP